MDELISVIIPAYNVERFVEDSINSVLSQSYKKLEIIIIDDGSTDRTGDICDEFAKNNSQISVIHTKNQGQGAARNIGLNVAKGQYIAFLDSDDYYESDALSSLLESVKRNDADMVVGRGIKVTEQGKICTEDLETVSHRFSNSEKIITEEDFWKRYSDNLYYILVTTKLFKAELLSSIRFPEGHINEDVEFSKLTAIQANRIVSIDKHIYNYRMREGSTVHSAFKYKNLYVIDAIHGIIDYVNNSEFSNKAKRYIIKLQFNRACKYMTDGHTYLDKGDKKSQKELRRLYNDYKPVARLLLKGFDDSTRSDLPTKVTMRMYLFSRRLFFFLKRIKRGNKEW